MIVILVDVAVVSYTHKSNLIIYKNMIVILVDETKHN